ncbi:HAD-IA family hydrolase [Shewanella inventionis]|uniref:Haloacid dehalogenase n=1 Tax=Shewanella inventionis TaxID=1738770 RepID=A0ABQ1JEY8_9GAMM|nr:HAD-IA family hydrolase [Shewanella inventionis]MCL1158216.1 HAD-IA family hydrolase [Shewanella inventionis]GGB64805.1 haloacid dehalogenase [Shewanella inventionis]
MLNSKEKAFDLIIFDWDGTLMDTVGKIVSCMQSVAQELMLPVPTEQQVRDVIGLSLPNIMPILFSQHHDHQQIIDCYRRHHLASDYPTPLFDGVEELIKQLHEAGYLLAIATGKAREGLDRVLELTGLGQYFHASRCASDAQSKPHPEMLHALLGYFDVAANKAIMVGDSIHDLTMANNAKMASIGVSYGAHDEVTLSPLKPLAIVDRVSAIRDYL